jgi:hypothetical protein
MAIAMTTYTSVYPPAHSDTYVKATSKYSTSYWPYYTTDPAKSLVGGWSTNQWVSGSGLLTNQRFHIDLGTAAIIRRIYYENAHNTGALTGAGVKNFILQGSNTAAAFADLTYATNTNWTDLTTAASQFDQHTAANSADPKYILVSNSVAYRYYAIKCADVWTPSDAYMGIRRLVLQTEITFKPGAIWF